MQINVLPAGSPQLFNAMLFPELHPNTKQWLHNQYHRDTSYLNDFGRNFVEKAQQVYQQYIDPFVMQKARELTRKIKGIAHPNLIRPLETIEDIQSAKPVMQRYIMAHPGLRRRYHQQSVDGYSDSYVDHDPGQIGIDHYDYRRVATGDVIFYEEEGQDRWKVTEYIDVLEANDRELSVDERFVIRDIWEIVESALEREIDPSDIFGGGSW